MKTKQKQEQKKKEKPKWYENLILDLKKIQYETLVKGKWMIGKRIIEEEGKPEYGEGTVKDIAKDMGVSPRELWLCIQFAKKCDDITLFTNKSWMHITHNVLPTSTKIKIIDETIDMLKLQKYDNDMYYISDSKYSEERFGDDIICIDRTHGENDVREYKDYYPTLTRLTRLFHPNGKEFTLREYAKVQDFSDDFKFVGSRSDIKDQIGEAVSPKMAEYIIKKHIIGKTYIELFCGCGGFSQGAKNSEKEGLWSIDFNRAAGYSHKLNFPETEMQINDITKVKEKEIHKKIGNVDFILGGPPCQGFSMAGKRLGFKEDKRNQLYLDYLRFVKEFKPKQFIMENVKEILEHKDEIIKDFEKIGYSVETEKVNGLDIGMKQKRIRVFFIGNKKDGDEVNR